MSVLLGALTRDDVAQYVNSLFIVFIVLVFIRVLLSWVPRMPYNRALRATVDFIHEVTDPFLNMFRRILPPIGGSSFALDLSPIVAIFLLLIAQKIVVGLIGSG